MPRKKVNVAYIENDTSRKITYNKRVNGLMKKSKELSILCGVDVCTLVYDPSLVVWPRSDTEARRILFKYKEKSETSQCQTQRSVDQEAYLKQSVMKSEERLLKLQRKSGEMVMENVMVDLLNGENIEHIPFVDMEGLSWIIDDRLRAIQYRIKVIEGLNNNVNDGCSC